MQLAAALDELRTLTERGLDSVVEDLDRRELGCHSALLQCERERARLEAIDAHMVAVEEQRQELARALATSRRTLEAEWGRLHGELEAIGATRSSLVHVLGSAAVGESVMAAASPPPVLLTLVPTERESQNAAKPWSLASIESELAVVSGWIAASALAQRLGITPARRVIHACRDLHRAGRCARRPVPFGLGVGDEDYQYGALALLPQRAAAAAPPFTPPRGSRLARASER
jgi:hypothetical protein